MGKTVLIRLIEVYVSSKKWFTYASLLIILVCLYFGDFLGPLRDVLFPASVVFVITIVIETLQNLENKLDSVHSEQRSVSTVEVLSIVGDLVRKYDQELSLGIIASTGGTVTSGVLPVLFNIIKAQKVIVRLNLINPLGASIGYCPDEWPSEVGVTLNKIRAQAASVPNTSLQVYCYDYLPAIHGILINKEHLLLGFYGWSNSPKQQLGGKQKPYLFFEHRDSNTEIYFQLFEEWLTHSPLELVFPPKP